MTQSSKKNRIIFIDLMRAFAVLMMVQGHTVDVLLADTYRDPGSVFFSIWLFMRGMTAPVFMFTAGTVFTYLFRLVDEPFESNPRVKKGIKRFLLLVCIGYLLRYPTSDIFNLSDISARQWKTFFSVDVLHCIGFGVLFLLLFNLIAEKTRLSSYIVFPAGGLFFFSLSPLFYQISWVEFLPQPAAGYFYTGSGSIFPLFPWVGYIIAGGALGSYLAANPLVFRSAKFSLTLLIISLIILASALLAGFLENFSGSAIHPAASPSVILLRTGFVLFLTGIISFISLQLNSIPRIIILIGRNTLLIYVVHLLILYGSAWNNGLSKAFARSFNVFNTVGTALLMILAMTLMVVIIHFLKIKNKELIT